MTLTNISSLSSSKGSRGTQSSGSSYVPYTQKKVNKDPNKFVDGMNNSAYFNARTTFCKKTGQYTTTLSNKALKADPSIMTDLSGYVGSVLKATDNINYTA